MDRYWTYLVAGTLAVLFLGLMPWADTQNQTKVDGTVLYSFNEPHALVQTDRFVYRIKMESLTAEERGLLQRYGSRVSLSLPSNAIDMAWAIEESKGPGLTGRITGVKEALSGIHEEKGQISIAGKVVPSFSEEFGFVQVGTFIYRIDKGRISKSEKSTLENSTGSVSIKVPKHSVDFAWDSEEAKTEGRSIANYRAGPLPDSVTEGKDSVFLRGTVVHSFSEPHFLVQSGNYVYQIKRADLMPRQAHLLEKPGSRVALTLPNHSIAFAWKIEHSLPGEKSRSPKKVLR